MLEYPVKIVAQQHQLWRDRLLAADPDLDEQTLADTLEGLTQFNEIVTAIVRAALEDEALAAALKGRVAAMEYRLSRLQERAAKRREIARDAMVEAGLKKITEPDFTISIRPGSPALVVVDEARIPARYWEPREPRLNRQALLAELKGGGFVEGTSLSNPQPTLSVRVK